MCCCVASKSRVCFGLFEEGVCGSMAGGSERGEEGEEGVVVVVVCWVRSIAVSLEAAAEEGEAVADLGWRVVLGGGRGAV